MSRRRRALPTRRTRVSGRRRALPVRHGGRRIRLRLSGRCRAPPVLTQLGRKNLGRHRRAEIRGCRRLGRRQFLQHRRALRGPQRVSEGNRRNRDQSETTQDNCEQPCEKEEEDDSAGSSQPAGALPGGVLEDSGSARRRSGGHLFDHGSAETERWALNRYGAVGEPTVNELHGHRSFTDSGGAALRRAGAHVAGSEDAGHARLEQ